MAAPKRILVTGASGFVGRHLMPVLRSAYPGVSLIAGDRAGAQTGAAVVGADEVVALDLLEPAAMASLLLEMRPDVVIHLAAQAMVHESFRDSEQFWRVNVDGTRALANILLKDLPGAFLVFASSAEVYGLTFQRGLPVNEDGPMAPANPYAASKAAADVALGEMALRGLKLARLRMFNQIGTGQSTAFVVSAFADQIARAEAGLQTPTLKVGALDRWREFIDVRDACDAYVAVLHRIGTLPPGVAINIASGGPPRRVGDILDALLARSRLQFEVETEQARLRPTDVASVSGDITRARELLDWAPRCDWNETLDLILADGRARVAAT